MSTDLSLNALEVLRTSNRPDLFIKYLYAKAFLTLDRVPDSIRDDYLESIRSFNGFYEEKPRKLSASDFISDFEQIILSLRSHGYVKANETEEVFITNRGEIVSGAHRVAACAALNINIQVSLWVERDVNYNYKFFVNRFMDDQVMNRSLITKSSLDQNLRCLIIHGKVSDEIAKKIELDLENITEVFLKKELKLGFESLTLIKFINYLFPVGQKNSWAGNQQDNFRGLKSHVEKSIGVNSTRFFFLSCLPIEALTEFKTSTRLKYDLDNASIHSTDSFEECKAIADLFSYDVFLRFFQSSAFKTDLALMDDLSKLSRALKDQKVDLGTSFILGSFVLALFNLRSSRDFDIFSFADLSFESMLEQGRQFSIHSVREISGNPPNPNVLFDSASLFSFFGLKVSTLEWLRQVKIDRNEFPKDQSDVILIEKFLALEKKKTLKNFIGRRYVILTWRIYNRIHRIKVICYSKISKVPSLYYFLRKSKKLLLKIVLKKRGS
jgi:hypothetical protein